MPLFYLFPQPNTQLFLPTRHTTNSPTHNDPEAFISAPLALSYASHRYAIALYLKVYTVVSSGEAEFNPAAVASTAHLGMHAHATTTARNLNLTL